MTLDSFTQIYSNDRTNRQTDILICRDASYYVRGVWKIMDIFKILLLFNQCALLNVTLMFGFFWRILDTDYMDKVSHQYVPTSVSSSHHFVWNILDTNYMDKVSHQYVSTGVSLSMKNMQMPLDKPCKDTVSLLCVF